MADVTIDSLGLAPPKQQAVTIESLGLAAPPRPPESSLADRLWSGAKEVAGDMAERLWRGDNMLGLPGKNAIEKSAEFEVPYKPGMTAGQMIPSNWQENPMLSAFGPGNILGRGAQGLMPPRPAPPTAPVIPPPAAPRPSTVQPGVGPGTVMSGPVSLTPPVMRPAAVQPGAGPIQAIPAAPGAAMPPPPPAMPPVGAAPPSALAAAIATDNPGMVDQTVTRGYRRAIQPGTTGVKMSGPGLAEEDQRIMTVVDKIIANRKDIKLTNPDGSAIPDGTLPRTRRQFLEAQDQTKKALFKEYNDMNRQAGTLGVQVDPAPAIAHLREVETNPAIVDAHPAVAREAKRFADAMEGRGLYTTEAMQDMIQDLNGRLSSFYKNPGSGSASEARILAPVVDMLRNQLDTAIEGASGPGYQAFRTQYGAMRSVERDLTAAARKELSQRPGFISEYGDLLASESFIRGVFTLNPGTIARTGAWKVARDMVKYVNDPNRAVRRLFDHRMGSLASPPPPSFMQNIYPPVTRELSRPEERGTGQTLRASVGQF